MPIGVYIRTKKRSQESKEKIRNALLGLKRTDETKNKIRKSKLGTHASEETRKKMSESHTGIKNPLFGKTGKDTPCFGRTGDKHPMFGKHHSEETKKKMSITRTGKRASEETKKKMSIISTGRVHSNKTKLKISKCNKGRLAGAKNPMFGKTGERHPMFGKTGERHPMFGKHHSEETKKKLHDTHIGENNSMYGRTGSSSPNWKGGTSYGIYCLKFNERRKRAVRDYFNNLCICTGEPQYNKALNVHHVDHDKEQGCNGKPFNLVPMCDKHHNLEQHHREEYKAYINKTLREGFKWGIWNEEEYMEKVMY